MDRNELATLVAEQVLLPGEVQDILGITRQRLAAIVKTRKLIPVKQARGVALFLRSDVEARAQIQAGLREKFYRKE